MMKKDTVFQISDVDLCVRGSWQKHVCIINKATGIRLGCLDQGLALLCILGLDNVYIHVSFFLRCSLEWILQHPAPALLLFEIML